VTITTCEDCKREIPDGEKRRCIIEDGVSTSWCKECLKKQGPIEDVLKEHYEKEVLVDFRANLQSGDRVHVIVKDQDCGVMVLKEPSAKGCWYMMGSSNSYNECWLFPVPEPEKDPKVITGIVKEGGIHLTDGSKSIIHPQFFFHEYEGKEIELTIKETKQ